MLRKVLIGTALAGMLASGTATSVRAQPPSPPELVRHINHDVRHALTHTDRAVRHAAHHARHRARTLTHHRVRAMCNDGRVHTGRTRVSACAGHGGLRG